MNRKFKSIAIQIVGWIFVLLGIAGLFLPVLQGILFLLIGLVILSSEYVWAHHLLGRVKARFPKLAGHIDHASARGQRWIRRIFHGSEAAQ